VYNSAKVTLYELKITCPNESIYTRMIIKLSLEVLLCYAIRV